MDMTFKIDPKNETITWQVINDRVKKGFKLQEKADLILSDDDIINYNDSIIIAPDYQREYRSTIADESSLIESALLEIPIPPIFFASHKIKGVQVLNVVDGQHRLRAFHRFFEGKFKLKDLTILKEFEGKGYTDIGLDNKVTLNSRGVSAITFRNFPGKSFELEIFNRYNKGTKPLTGQEIRNAVYNSKFNMLVNTFCNNIFDEGTEKVELKNAYAVSKDRYLKKTIHENIFVILSVLEFGVLQSYNKINKDGVEVSIKISSSPKYAENYMRIKSQISDENIDEILKTEDYFRRFNCFVLSLTNITPYPFSKEIYGYSSKRGNKFQVSISMILAGIFKKMTDNSFDFDILSDKDTLDKFSIYLKNFLNNSYLEDPEYKASTTNPDEISKLVKDFNFHGENHD